jgi:hypothetical protein
MHQCCMLELSVLSVMQRGYAAFAGMKLRRILLELGAYRKGNCAHEAFQDTRYLLRLHLKM